MSQVEPLAGVRSKVERAKKHIVDLDAAISAFWKTCPYEIGTKRDEESRRLIYYVTKVDCVPTDIALIAGEAVHCLRSALDQLAYQMFFSCGGTGKPNKVYFPISDDTAKYKAELPGKVQGMSPAAIAAFDALEPYKGGKGHNLWVIHALDNIDKHRVLVTVGGAYADVDIGQPMIEAFRAFAEQTIGPFDIDPAGFSLRIRPQDSHCPLNVGDELFGTLPDEQPNEKYKFTFDIAIHEPGVIERQPLIVALKNFVDVVDNIIGQLARFV